MALDFATLVYEPCFEVFARPVTFYPLVSQPTVASYSGRGIFDCNDYNFDMYDNIVQLSDAKIELDIYAPEFPIIPMKDDQIYIPKHLNIPGGSFIVADVSANNAGGEITLTLRSVVEAKAPGYLLALPPIYVLGALDLARPSLTVV